MSNTYENRVLNKVNYFLKKFGENTSKYTNYSKYTNWIKQKPVPEYPFSYESQECLKIRISKRQKNKAKVLSMKDFMVKIESREVSVDELANFICIYTIIDKQKIKQTNQPISKPPIKPISKPPIKPISEPPIKPTNNLIVDDQDPPDSWESLI